MRNAGGSITADAAHGREVDLIAVGGGDGTLNAAADCVMQMNRPLGILPMGTANDLARTLGIPADLDAAVQIIAAGRTRRIDLDLVNGHPFFNVASIGLQGYRTWHFAAWARMATR
jgi:diacylglycerol kinase family enzyme